MRRWRKNNPIRYAYQTLRDNSKRRGKEFTLTLDEFRQFCRETEYLAGKGRTATSYTIDRIDNTKGYTLDNIRVLSNAENARKKDRKILLYDWQLAYATVITRSA